LHNPGYDEKADSHTDRPGHAPQRMCRSRGEISPGWESLKQYEVPDWFRDAKFGIYFHWGLYSVPAYKTEWYPHYIYGPVVPPTAWGFSRDPIHPLPDEDFNKRWHSRVMEVVDKYRPDLIWFGNKLNLIDST
jgi:hypothetical protein